MRIIIIVAINLLSILTVYASINHATIKSDPGIEQWSEANEIFRMDPHWKGSDGAYSIKIGTNRVLWLFGDTLISSQNSFARS